MSPEQIDRSILAGKDRDELHTIASAIGVKAATRMRKADLVEAIMTAVEGGNGSGDAPVVRRAQVLWQSVPYDLAVLRVDGLDGQRRPIAIADPDQVGLHRADRVWKAGYPGGSDFGIASNYRPTDGRGFNLRAIVDPGTVRAPPGSTVYLSGQRDTAARVIEHNAPINPGDSGGPLIDACGRVVAINEHKVVAQTVDSTYRSVDAVHLIDALRTLGIPFQLDNRRCASDGPNGPMPVDPEPLAVPSPATTASAADAALPAAPPWTRWAAWATAAALAALALGVALLVRHTLRLRRALANAAGARTHDTHAPASQRSPPHSSVPSQP